MQDTTIQLSAYDNLIHKFCRKFYGRAINAGFVMEYDDVYQDGIETFLRCRETFNPATGHQFSTYLTLALRHNLNHTIEHRTPMASLDAMADHAGDDGMDLASLGLLEDPDGHTPDWHLEVKEAIALTNARLSTWAKFALQQIMAPSAFLKAELARHQANIAALRAQGRDARSKELSVEFIVRVFGPLKGYDTESRQNKLAREIRAEFSEVAHALHQR